MKYSRLWISAAIIAIIVLVSFALSVPHTYDGIQPAEIAAPVPPVVAVRDAFKKGSHTIAGSIKAPDACTTAHAEAVYVASSTGSIVVTISMPEDTGICLEVPTMLQFSTTVDAAAGLPIVVMVNGVQASTTPL